MATSTRAKVGERQTGVQSAVTVLEVLSAFVGAEQAPMLKTLAERAGMHPAKVHRYLVSLCKKGYVEQNQDTSRYRLGPASLRLAFAALSAVDGIQLARLRMPEFVRQAQATMVFSVWTLSGPTIAVIETVPGVLTLTVREGTVLPILRSSTGRVFGAWMPRPQIEPLIQPEMAQLRREPIAGVPTSVAQADELFADIRRRGLSRVTGQLSSIAHSFAAPVWKASAELAGALTILGPAGQFDSSWSSPHARTVLQCAAELSQGLGYVGPDGA